jgi:hypothetical protein
MTNSELKSSLHKLIDSMDNEEQLKNAYQILDAISIVQEEGVLWKRLSTSEQQELLDIEKECSDPSILIDHDQAFKMHKKWL